MAQSLACGFHLLHSFNHGKLLRPFHTYAKSAADEEDVLHTWGKGTKKHFAPILHIMSYRCILFLVDDGPVNLGAPITPPRLDSWTFTIPGR